MLSPCLFSSQTLSISFLHLRYSMPLPFQVHAECPCCSLAGADRSTREDEDTWNWFTLPGWSENQDAPTEVTRPKRLVQQIESEEEMSHHHLDTRVKNSSVDTVVSEWWCSSDVSVCLEAEIFFFFYILSRVRWMLCQNIAYYSKH